MIDVIDLPGSASERGLAAGRQLGERMRGLLAAWLGSLEPLGGEVYVRDFLRETAFRPAIEEHCPDLLAEVDGIAAGAGIEPDLMFALQLMDEEWAYRVRTAGRRSPQKCSSLAIVSSAGPTWIGQNMDLGPYTDGFQIVIRPDRDGERPGALLFTITGMLALMGVNAAGVGVCVNSLPQLPSAPSGVPVAFMIRKLLQARDLAEAAEWVQSLPHATNQHYLIAQAGAARSFECSAGGVNEYHAPDPHRVLHTNHPLADEKGVTEGEAERNNSVQRLNSLVDRLAIGAPNLETIKAALSACDDPRNPVCRVYDPAAGLIGFTCGSLISELEPGAETIQAWASPGPLTRGYVPVTLAAEH